MKACILASGSKGNSTYIETKISDKLSTISTMITVDNFNDAGIPIYDPNTNQISQSHAWVGKETISLDENGNPEYDEKGWWLLSKVL